MEPRPSLPDYILGSVMNKRTTFTLQLNHKMITMKKLFTTLSLLAIAFVMHAQVNPTLIKDIMPGAEDSDVQEVTLVGNRIFFWANDGVHGMELWVSDATEAGTYMVKDIAVGAAFSLWNPEGTYATKSLTDVDGTAFFFANDGIHGYELWKSDGTEEGTVMVKDIGQDDEGIMPNNDVYAECIAIDGILYFVAYSEGSGHEVWRSDGTEEGTYMLGESIKGDNYTTYPCNLTNSGGSLWFGLKAFNPVAGIFRYDGLDLVQVSSAMLSKNNQQSQNNFVWYNDYVYFAAGDAANNMHVWRSTGGSASAELFFQTNPTGQSRPHTFLPIESGFMFTAEGEDDEQVFISNGLENGTVPLEFSDGSVAYTSSGNSLSVTYFLPVNGGYYWNGENGLCFTDGTNANTRHVANYNFIYHNADWYDNKSTAVGSHVVFAEDNLNIKSDGTTAGTSIVCEDWHDSNTLVTLGDKVIMVTHPFEDDAIGQELYYIVPDFEVAVTEVEKQNQWLIYPNPSKDEIRIDGLNGKSNVSIYNNLGSLVKQEQVNANESIVLPRGLSAGVYSVKIESETMMEMHQFILAD